MGEKEGREENEVFSFALTFRSQRILDAAKSLNGDTLVVMTIDRKIEMLNFIQEEAEKLKLLLRDEKERRKLKGERRKVKIEIVDQIAFEINDEVFVFASKDKGTNAIRLHINTHGDDCVNSCIDNPDDTPVVDFCASLLPAYLLSLTNRLMVYNPELPNKEREDMKRVEDLVATVLEAFRIIKEGK